MNQRQRKQITSLPNTVSVHCHFQISKQLLFMRLVKRYD